MCGCQIITGKQSETVVLNHKSPNLLACGLFRVG